MKKAFPVLLSLPHGGTEIPEEVRDRVAVEAKDLFEDGDAFTREIYGLGEEVGACVESKIARAFIDMNRAPEDRPPQNPDGVVKTHTCHGLPLYREGTALNTERIRLLLDRYYHPYHRAIQSHLQHRTDLVLGLDCHSMEPVGPPLSPSPGRERPLICLGTQYGKSCPQDLAEALAEAFRKAFDLERKDLTFNRPFAGGFITRTYGARPLPWVQVEMNRALYLRPPWFHPARQAMDPARLGELRDKFRQTLALFFSR